MSDNEFTRTDGHRRNDAECLLRRVRSARAALAALDPNGAAAAGLDVERAALDVIELLERAAPAAPLADPGAEIERLLRSAIDIAEDNGIAFAAAVASWERGSLRTLAFYSDAAFGHSPGIAAIAGAVRAAARPGGFRENVQTREASEEEREEELPPGHPLAAPVVEVTEEEEPESRSAPVDTRQKELFDTPPPAVVKSAPAVDTKAAGEELSAIVAFVRAAAFAEKDGDTAGELLKLAGVFTAEGTWRDPSADVVRSVCARHLRAQMGGKLLGARCEALAGEIEAGEHRAAKKGRRPCDECGGVGRHRTQPVRCSKAGTDPRAKGNRAPAAPANESGAT